MSRKTPTSSWKIGLRKLGENIFSKMTEIIMKNTFIVNGTIISLLKSKVVLHCYTTCKITQNILSKKGNATCEKI